MMDEQVTLFETAMSVQEQIELSNLLDKFTQMYENCFYDQLHDDIELSSEDLQYELGSLYRFVKDLEKRVL